MSREELLAVIEIKDKIIAELKQEIQIYRELVEELRKNKDNTAE